MIGRGSGHRSDFSLKVPAKPVNKSGAGSTVRRSCAARTTTRNTAENPKMVTIKVNNLIDFVADVFSHAESSAEEARRIATYLTTANLTGHDSHGVIRVPVYVRWKKTGNVVPNQTAGDRRRYAVARGGRWQVRLWADGDAVCGEDRHREVQEGGPCRGRAAQCRPYRPRRRLGGDGGGRKAGVGALRQCRRLAAGCAVRRRREAAVDRALLRRHSARRGRTRSCWISPPRSSPKARCWWQAAAARSCRRAR